MTSSTKADNKTIKPLKQSKKQLGKFAICQQVNELQFQDIAHDVNLMARINWLLLWLIWAYNFEEFVRINSTACSLFALG